METKNNKKLNELYKTLKLLPELKDDYYYVVDRIGGVDIYSKEFDAIQVGFYSNLGCAIEKDTELIKEAYVRWMKEDDKCSKCGETECQELLECKGKKWTVRACEPETYNEFMLCMEEVENE